MPQARNPRPRRIPDERTFHACLLQLLHLSSFGNPCDGINALTPKELKQELVAMGFLVLRTDSRRVVLAARERENLIMDSGVWIEFDPDAALLDAETRFVVGCAVRSHHSDNRGESPLDGQARARTLTGAFERVGYCETGVRSVDVTSPSAPDQILDTWHEVLLAKANVRWADLAVELASALRLPKVAASVSSLAESG